MIFRELVLLVTVKFLLHEERGGGIDSNLSVQGACMHRFSVRKTKRGNSFRQSFCYACHDGVVDGVQYEMDELFLHHHAGQSDIGRNT